MNTIAHTSLHHVEFAVADAEAAALDLVHRYGFRIAGRTPAHTPDRLSVALLQNGITLVLTQALTPHHPAHASQRAHGDAVMVIAVRCHDARTVFDNAVAGGAKPLEWPTQDPRTGCVTAQIQAFGDVRHALLSWPAGSTTQDHLPPGIHPLSHHDRPATTASGAGLRAIDHFAVCLPAGSMTSTVDFYVRALGFRRIFEEQIVVGGQAMLSQVVQNPGGDVTLTLIEPDPSHAPGQIDTYLRDHGGAGVQHIAFSCENVVNTTRTLRAAGVTFLSSPDSYYAQLPQRLTLGTYDTEQLRELGLLADSDHAGQLFQVFTRSTHPRRTFFLELIERQGATTFGSGNIKALYQAVEQDHALLATAGV
ncbi:4-hydroxyphenylpyruvate dioxygenase [Streptacidiphilus sp. MAP12-20]|uniref:4-hydroxyphenylpyruvate dioxygenase n=1 Tax=Streptacidiphilus sp. MAP12-20 TaxID=3156299 RepID=UPI00351638C0